MAYPKLYLLVNKLFEATNNGRLKWEETIDVGVYQASISDVSVRIREQKRKDPNSQIKDYILSIYNERGDLIEEVRDDILDEGDEIETPYFIKMREMYEIARRQAEGSEAVLDKIINELDDGIPF